MQLAGILGGMARKLKISRVTSFLRPRGTRPVGTSVVSCFHVPALSCIRGGVLLGVANILQFIPIALSSCTKPLRHKPRRKTRILQSIKTNASWLGLSNNTENSEVLCFHEVSVFGQSEAKVAWILRLSWTSPKVHFLTLQASQDKLLIWFYKSCHFWEPTKLWCQGCWDHRGVW